MARTEYSFEIEQGGIMVAGASGSNLKDVVREACHYVFMYAQDGPVKVTGTDKFMAAFKAVPGSEKHI